MFLFLVTVIFFATLLHLIIFVMKKKSFNKYMETLKSVKIFFLCCVLCWLGSCQNAKEQMDKIDREANTTQENEVEAVKLDKYLLPNLTYENGAAIVDWSILLDMQYDIRYVEQFETEIPFPIFNETIKSLNGKPIIVTGYIIPVEETGESSIVFLSAFPYSECFFLWQCRTRIGNRHYPNE